jgi:hypothetical protein
MSTFISTVILLNLIIAFISDSYGQVMEKIEEKKNKTINAMTLRLEKVMFWKKASGKKSLLIWGDYMKVENNKDDKQEEMSEIFYDQQQKSFEIFHKSMKSMLYDITLLIIQFRQKIFNKIESQEDQISLDIYHKRKILRTEISYENNQKQQD